MSCRYINTYDTGTNMNTEASDRNRLSA